MNPTTNADAVVSAAATAEAETTAVVIEATTTTAAGVLYNTVTLRMTAAAVANAYTDRVISWSCFANINIRRVTTVSEESIAIIPH